jgi:hypothetical protein
MVAKETVVDSKILFSVADFANCEIEFIRGPLVPSIEKSGQ